MVGVRDYGIGTFLSFGRTLAFVALEVGRRDTFLSLGVGRESKERSVEISC